MHITIHTTTGGRWTATYRTPVGLPITVLAASKATPQEAEAAVVKLWEAGLLADHTVSVRS